MRTSAIVPALLLWIVLDAGVTHGQPTPQLIRETDSTYKVIVGTDTLWAITNSMRKAHMQSIRELRAMRALAEVDSTVMDAHAKVAQACTNVHTLDLALIQHQRAQIADYDTLTKALQLKISPWLSYEWGVGGNRQGPAVLGGLGIKKLRLWGTFQERGSAVYAGVFAPIH